jgi:SAM-dependent methyltransferase
MPPDILGGAMHRSHEEELFLDGVRRLAAGRMASSMLELALDLDVFGRLRGRSLTPAELARELEMPAPSTRMLAQFLCREGLLLFDQGRLANAPVVEKALTTDTWDRREVRKVLKLALPMEALRQRLFQPPVLHWYQLREQGEITDGSSMVGQKPEGWFAAFQANNHAPRIQWGEDLAAVYDFSGHRLLLDVGGASGGWCMGIRKTNPHLRCLVFDLPEVRELAERCIAEAGEGEAMAFVAGSFFEDALPVGADVALLANVLHNWEPEDGLAILRKVHDALEPGGTLLVKEYFFEDDWTGRGEAVFEAFILLGPEGRSGWQPSYGETEDLLRRAGFQSLERRPDLVVATR